MLLKSHEILYYDLLNLYIKPAQSIPSHCLITFATLKKKERGNKNTLNKGYKIDINLGKKNPKNNRELIKETKRKQSKSKVSHSIIRYL